MNIQTVPNNTENIYNKEEDKRIKKSYDQFGELFAKKMLEEQFKNTELTTGVGSNIIKGMYVDSLSEQLGSKLGIGELLYEDYKRGQNGRKN